MVEIAQRTEKVTRSTHLVPNDQPMLPCPLDLEQLDHGPVPVTLLDLPNDFLIQLERIL